MYHIFNVLLCFPTVSYDNYFLLPFEMDPTLSQAHLKTELKLSKAGDSAMEWNKRRLKQKIMADKSTFKKTRMQ